MDNKVTTIQFKRGSANAISNYHLAKKGEPVFDHENHLLYVCSGQLLLPQGRSLSY